MFNVEDLLYEWNNAKTYIKVMHEKKDTAAAI